MRAEIRAAVWAYRTAAGRRRLAYFGDVVDLTEDEYERADRAGVLTPEPVAAEPVVELVLPDGGDLFPRLADDSDDDQSDQDDGDGSDEGDQGDDTAVPRPASTTSPKAEWHAYAVSRGIPAEEAGRMSRAEIAARLPEA
ncbi:hypothetical protein F5X71_00365 [Nocardia brasiliensis]|uniref:Uncharacterized protein n=1 Tax=Nocardia brasiliensis TaxID=37326 RepID=A0A6G9XJ95_NOCBR|nr:hypothetical protein [Nocardia brasiliensis]QIS00986.1 hypothetical protein F5X71_00365 [Nocardia brasiliensis]